MSWRSGQAGCNIGKKPLYTGPSSGGFCSFSFCRQLRTGLCQVSCGLRAGPPPTAALLYDLRLSKRNVRRSQGEEAAVVAGGRGNRIRWCPGRRPISFSFFCGQVLPAVTNDFLFQGYYSMAWAKITSPTFLSQRWPADRFLFYYGHLWWDVGNEIIFGNLRIALGRLWAVFLRTKSYILKFL